MTNTSGKADEWLNFLSTPEQALVARALRSWEFGVILWGVVTEHTSETLPGTDLYVCAKCGVGLEPAFDENDPGPANIAEGVEMAMAMHWAELLADEVVDGIVR